MRILIIVVLTCIVTPVYAQQRGTAPFPTTGNELLDTCGVMVEAADNPSYFTSLSDNEFTKKMGQFNWCAGYLAATQDSILQNTVNLALIAATGVTLAGPEKARQYAFDTLKGPCIPVNASVLQLARVLVKWLREHPERLHEFKNTLTLAAFTDAFTCQQPTPKDSGKPTVKP